MSSANDRKAPFMRGVTRDGDPAPPIVWAGDLEPWLQPAPRSVSDSAAVRSPTRPTQARGRGRARAKRTRSSKAKAKSGGSGDPAPGPGPTHDALVSVHSVAPKNDEALYDAVAALLALRVRAALQGEEGEES